jgi:hypothetical protein
MDFLTLFSINLKNYMSKPEVKEKLAEGQSYYSVFFEQATIDLKYLNVMDEDGNLLISENMNKIFWNFIPSVKFLFNAMIDEIHEMRISDDKTGKLIQWAPVVTILSMHLYLLFAKMFPETNKN